MVAPAPARRSPDELTREAVDRAPEGVASVGPTAARWSRETSTSRGVYQRSLDVSTDTPLLTDDALLRELRDECSRWATRDELEGGFARMFLLRDEARARGLPVPASCPQHDPEG